MECIGFKEQMPRILFVYRSERKGICSATTIEKATGIHGRQFHMISNHDFVHRMVHALDSPYNRELHSNRTR